MLLRVVAATVRFVETGSDFEPTVVDAFRRGWRTVLAVAVAVAIAGAIFAATRPVAFSATASLVVTDPRSPALIGTQPADAPERYVADQLTVFQSQTLGGAAAGIGPSQQPALEKSARWFLARTSASASAKDSNRISVSFTASTESDAIAGARVVVAAYRDVSRAAVVQQARAVKAQLDASILSLDARLADLVRESNDPRASVQVQQFAANRASVVARRDQVAAEAQFPADGVSLASLPTQATSNARSTTLRLLVLTFAAGALLGVAIAYVPRIANGRSDTMPIPSSRSDCHSSRTCRVDETRNCCKASMRAPKATLASPTFSRSLRRELQ